MSVRLSCQLRPVLVLVLLAAVHCSGGEHHPHSGAELPDAAGDGSVSIVDAGRLAGREAGPATSPASDEGGNLLDGGTGSSGDRSSGSTGEDAGGPDSTSGASNLAEAGAAGSGVASSGGSSGTSTVDTDAGQAGDATSSGAADSGPPGSPVPDAPFETRASMLGKLIGRTGGPVSAATFSVAEAPPPDGSGVVRQDVAVSSAQDGSFRLRLTNFPEAESPHAPPLHVLLRVEADGLLPVFRDAWLHAGTATDFGLIKMVPRDAASTSIGPAGGTARDSANRVEVVIPAGALSSTIDVVITPFDARDELPAVLPDSTVTMYGFELEPSGTTFNAPVTVRIANTKSIPTSLSIPTGFFDPKVGRWEHLGQAIWDGERFAFTTTHFTTMDANAKRGKDPGVGPLPGPPPAPPPPPSPCDPAGGDPGGPPDPGPSPQPLGNVGSSATLTGGSLNQSFRLPTYRVRNEDFHVTLAYDSRLAGGHEQGQVADQYEAAEPSAYAVSVRGLRLSALCVPAATSIGDRGSPTAQRPGQCAAQASCSLGQDGGLPLRAEFSWGGASTTQTFNLNGSHTQADFSGFLRLPTQAGKLPSPGLYATHVVVNAESSGACVSSGGTFGVSDEQSAGVDLAVEPGPLATFDYHELVNHRLNSPYGTGWTIGELERVYRSGDVAFLARGDGAEERFRPRAYPVPLTDTNVSAFRMVRDPQTGEILLVHDNGVIEAIDPATGAVAPVLSGLDLSVGVRSAAVAYVGATRHFAIALATGLVDVDAEGNTTLLATRTAPSQFRDANVAARGDLVFYTDAVSASLYRTRLSDPSHAVEELSLATGGDVCLFPRTPLAGVSFADPRGMDFGRDGTLYLADVRRNTVYALSPQDDGEVGAASRVAPAVGDGTSTFFAPLGERAPGVKLAIREPLTVSAAEDGTLLIVTAYGAAWYDPLAREAEWLAMWANLDEMRFNPTQFAVSAQALGSDSFLIRDSLNSGVVSTSVVRIDVDRLSSEFEPTRTLTELSDGRLQLVDTTRAVVEQFDSNGRITERTRRTGELMMGFAYTDARSDKLDYVTDPVGGETTFAYDSAGKLERITDPRGRSTTLTVTEPGDLTTFSKPDAETYQFTYEKHRMTRKASPRGDVTTYSFRPDGTLQTAVKPGGQTTTVAAVLSRSPSYNENGKIARSGSYVDGRGVTHEVETNLRGDIEKDTYVADGVSYVEQAVYATDIYIRDILPQNRAPLDQTMRKNAIFRVSQRTLNGVSLGPERKMWDAHFRPLDEFVQGTSASTHGFMYTSDGWLRAETRGAAWAQVFDRDAAGRVTQIYDSNGWGTNAFPVSGALVAMNYGPDGQVSSLTQHAVERTFAYDSLTANKLGWTDSIGRSRTLVRDALGNVTQTTDGTAVIYASYDALNRVVETHDALNHVTTYGYADAGCGCSQDNLVTNIHTPDLPIGSAWQISYDADSRISAVTDPQGAIQRFSYEPTGQLAAKTDPLMRASLWTYDELGRVLSMVDALGRAHASSHAVPTNGQWEGPTLTAGSPDATPPSTSLALALRPGEYQIGNNARLAGGFPAAISLYRDATFELGFSRTFDSRQRTIARFDRSGLAIDSTVASPSTANFWNQQYSWNVYTARPVLALVGTYSLDVGYKNSDYSQDAYFDSATANGSGYQQSLETVTRDAAGRVTTLERSFTQGRVGSSTYAYQADGRLSQVVNADGTHDFAYDSRGLVQTQVAPEGAYTYGYDEMGRNALLTYPDGHTRTQRYDSLGRLTSRCYEYAAAVKRCYTAEYDAVGNPTRMEDPDGTDVFTYDALYRLMQVTRQANGNTVDVEDYAYNALGALKLNAGVALDDQRPRLNVGGTADAAVPASVGGQPVVLDPGGRVTSLNATTLKWSGDGALREAASSSPGEAEAFGVDAHGRRFSRSVGGVIAEYYIYEGLDRVAVVAPNGSDPQTGFSVPGPVLEGYLFDGIDHPLRVRIEATSTTAYYELDLAGNVRALRASGGASLGGYRYSAFGQTLEDTTTLAQPLRWKGRWLSPLAGGVYDVRARQWCPELGIFLSVDEFEFHDPQTTLWGWPGQNPVRWRDPSGHQAVGPKAPPPEPAMPAPPGGGECYHGPSAADVATGVVQCASCVINMLKAADGDFDSMSSVWNDGGGCVECLTPVGGWGPCPKEPPPDVDGCEPGLDGYTPSPCAPPPVCEEPPVPASF